MSVNKDLWKLHKLRAKGRLTESEFDRAKAAILNAVSASPEERLKIEERLRAVSERVRRAPRRPWPRSLKATVIVILCLLLLALVPLLYDLVEDWLFEG